jgi:hypothetical protein
MLNYVGMLFPISFLFQFSLDYCITYLGDDDINSPKVVLLKTWFLMEFVKYKIIHMLSPYKLFAYICVFKLFLLRVFKLQDQKTLCIYMHVSMYKYILTRLPNDVLTGADIASGPVWMEYISFLKSLPVS